MPESRPEDFLDTVGGVIGEINELGGTSGVESSPQDFLQLVQGVAAQPAPGPETFSRRALEFAADQVEEFELGLRQGFLESGAGLGNTEANLFMLLDSAAQKVNEMTGSEGGAFQMLEEHFRASGTGLAKAAFEVGGNKDHLLNKIGHLIGALPVVAGETAAAVMAAGPVIGIGGIEFLSAADRGLLEATKRGLTGAAIGKLFSATHGFNPASRFLTLGAAEVGRGLSLGEELEDTLLPAAATGFLASRRAFGAQRGGPGVSDVVDKQIDRFIKNRMAGQAKRLASSFEGANQVQQRAILRDMENLLITEQQRLKFAQLAGDARTGEKVIEAWINSILSGPSTQTVNIVSNAMVSMYDIPRAYVAAGSGLVRSGYAHSKWIGGRARDAVRRTPLRDPRGRFRGPTPRPTVDRVFFREANARLFGTLEGIKDGMRVAAKTFLTEVPDPRLAGILPTKATLSQSLGAVERLNRGRPFELTPAGSVLELSSKLEVARARAIAGATGAAVRIPGRFLMATDDFFKMVSYRRSINGQAVRISLNRGHTGDKFMREVSRLKMNPTNKMMQEASEEAAFNTFTTDLRRGSLVRRLQEIPQNHPTAKVFVPFFRTPVNIFKFAARNSPIGVFGSDVRRSLAAGGAIRDREISRLLTGTAMLSGAAALAMEGLITGSGPADPELRRIMINNGWRPYSITLPGWKPIPFGRFEPLGLHMGLTADIAPITGDILGLVGDYVGLAGHMTDEEKDETVQLMQLAFRRNIESKTFIQGITGAVLAVTEPEQYFEGFAQRLASSVVPNVMGQGNQLLLADPELKRVDSIFDAVKRRTPGFSDTLLPMRNIYGEPVLADKGYGYDIITPFFRNQPETDPITDELIRTGAAEGLVPPRETIRGVRLEPKEHDAVLKLTGQVFRLHLEQLINSERYRAFQRSPTAQAKMIRDDYSSIKESVGNLVEIEMIRAGDPRTFELGKLEEKLKILQELSGGRLQIPR